MPSIAFIAHNSLDCTVTFAIDRIRYEYFLPNPLAISRVEYISRISSRKALNLAKRLAVRTERSNA